MTGPLLAAERSDGMLRKLMNVDRLNGLGWRFSIDFSTGMALTYKSYLADLDQ